MRVVLIAVVREQARRKIEGNRFVEVQPDRRKVALTVNAIAAIILPNRDAHFLKRIQIAVDRSPINTTPLRQIVDAQAKRRIIEYMLDPAEPSGFTLNAFHSHETRSERLEILVAHLVALFIQGQ